MPVWPALLLAPLFALAEQSIVYALSSPACRHQREAWLHGVPLLFVAATLLFTLMAWREWRRLRRDGPPSRPGDDSVSRRHFVAAVAVGSGALSTLAIVAMWLPQWVLSPCAS